MRVRQMARMAWLAGLALGFGWLLAATVWAAGENLASFQVRQDGKVVKTWTLSEIRKLPLVPFENRQGKERQAVLLSNLLERSGVPLERIASVTVTGLGGDSKKGPSTKMIEGEKSAGPTVREFKGDELRQSQGQAVVFHNPDKHWTLSDRETRDPGPWDPNRVRKVRTIDVTLKRP
jgi:hypothetical protein